MKYKYETHCHTKYSSACSRFEAEEIVKMYLTNGYSGVCITDHFLNGNCTVNKKMPDASYEEKIRDFCEGYKQVKKAAEGTDLQVFFGVEYSYKGTDILLYGLDEEALINFPEIMDMKTSELCTKLNGSDVLAVQAHPFREAGYIDHVRIFGTVEGIEVYNSSREPICNKLGEFYANETGKLKIGGSDSHSPLQPKLSGMQFDTKANDIFELISLIRSGKGEIIDMENQYKG